MAGSASAMPSPFKKLSKPASARLVGREVRLHGSGRTDAGVHALGQVAHFRTESKLPLAAFREGLNSLLPRDIVILQAEEAPAGFHARYGAKAKTYEYRILNRTVRSPLHLRHCWHLGLALDLDRMREATRFIMGEHDFAGFQSSGSAVQTTIRRVLAATWEERPGDWIYFRITASGFLRGMVRALVGTLVEVGRGKRQPEDMARLLASGRPPAGRSGRAGRGTLPGGGGVLEVSSFRVSSKTCQANFTLPYFYLHNFSS